jgi:hypothetical protein
MRDAGLAVLPCDAFSSFVIAGLDPAIHLLRSMDCRVTTLRVGPAMTTIIHFSDC